MQNGGNIFAKYSPSDPPASPSAASDPSATARTPPADKTPVLHQIMREPAFHECRWFPPPELPAAPHREPAPAQLPDRAALCPPPDGPAPQPGSGRAYYVESDRERCLSLRRWRPASNTPSP